MKNHLNFSWIIEGSLAGAQGPTDPQDLTYFRSNGVKAVVRMERRTISAEPGDMVDLYEPVIDFTPPGVEQIQRIVKFIDEQVGTLGQPVVVTCAAGLGRTGTVLASYLVSIGYEPQQAIQLVRDLRPGSIQTRQQEERVHEFADSLKSQPRESER